MPIYNVYLKTDTVRGTPAYSYEHAEVVDWNEFPLTTYDHVEAPAVEAPPVVVVPVRITKLAFRNRFTRTEKATIEMAALDNAGASLPARLAAAGLRADLADQRDATHIDLTRPETRSGVQALEAAGLIAAGRAAVILDTPPTQQEVWNG